MSKKRPSNSILNYLEFKRVRTPTPVSSDATAETAELPAELPTSMIVSERSVQVTPVTPLPLVMEMMESAESHRDEVDQSLLQNIRTTHPNDIGNYVNVKIPNQIKIDILNNIWIPSCSYEFTAGHRNLRFKHHWFSQWKWLAFSDLEQGAFCKYCVLFSRDGAGIGRQPLGQLCKKNLPIGKMQRNVLMHIKQNNIILTVLKNQTC